MWDVFVSYSRKNIATMQRVRDTLRNHGLQVWTDETLEPGTPIWEKEIENAIETAQCMVVLLSLESKDSEWVRAEINHAKRHKLHIIPVHAHGDDAAIPIGLGNYQRIDIRFSPDKEIQKLAEFVQGFIKNQTSENIFRADEANLGSQYQQSDDILITDRSIVFEDIRFDDLVGFERYKVIPQSEQHPGHYPLFSSTGIQNYIDDYVLDGNYVIIPNIISPSSPTAYQVEGKLSATSSVFVVSTKPNIEPDYLVLVLEKVNPQRFVSVGGIMPRINKNILRDLILPVPSISDQRRLVHSASQIRQRIEESRQLHIEALAELDSLLPTILDRMFKQEL